MVSLASRLSLLLFAAVPLVATGQTEPRAPSFRLLLEVRDADTGEPLAGAHAAVDSVIRVTDLDGRATFRGLGTDSLTIGAAFLGYAPADTVLVLDKSARVVFMLKVAPEALAEVEITAERFNTARLNRVGFYERRDRRSGAFITAEDLQKRGAVSFSDVFRAVPGIRIETQYGRAYLTSTRRRNCSPPIFLDGTRAYGLEEFLDSISLRDVLAVEVYRGPAEVPIEYSATINGTDCGAVLVWTRAR